jgi:hypothetical protein
MKPIREYLQELPSPYNTLALSVVDETYKGYQVEVNSLHNAILYMCNWNNTSQGDVFWKQVYEWCVNPINYQLPPIPAVEVEKPISEVIEKANQENQTKPFCGFEFSPEVEQETVQDPKPTSEQIASFIVDLIAKTEKLEQENTELNAKLAELLSNPKELLTEHLDALPIGTVIHVLIEFGNSKGYRMQCVSKENYTCKDAFNWAHEEAEKSKGIIITYNYIFPPKKQ